MTNPHLTPLGGAPGYPPTRTFTIPLPYTAPPLSMNDRGRTKGAVYAKASTTASVQDTVTTLLAAHNVPRACDHTRVQLHYLPADNRRRDTDNLMATLKPICDAISDGTTKRPGYGVVTDDTPSYMTKPEPIIYHHPAGEKPRMWLTLDVWK